MDIKTVRIDKPEDVNLILGQSHFIKTVEDLYEALVGAVPGIKFGLAFCESSGACLVRWVGTDDEMTELAKSNAYALSAGHSFVVFLKNAYPVNVLNAIKMVPEVCRIFCATANPTEVIVAETEQGRGIIGVVDGSPPKGIEYRQVLRLQRRKVREDPLLGLFHAQDGVTATIAHDQVPHALDRCPAPSGGRVRAPGPGSPCRPSPLPCCPQG